MQSTSLEKTVADALSQVPEVESAINWRRGWYRLTLILSVLGACVGALASYANWMDLSARKSEAVLRQRYETFVARPNWDISKKDIKAGAFIEEHGNMFDHFQTESINESNRETGQRAQLLFPGKYAWLTPYELGEIVKRKYPEQATWLQNEPYAVPPPTAWQYGLVFTPPLFGFLLPLLLMRLMGWLAAGFTRQG